MKKPILLIMAAGMGSRFGGPKQIEPIDAHDHVILDFSVYDAIRAGFEKVVVIIKKEMEADFEERVGKRIRPHVQLEYAFQSLDKLPAGFAIPEGRVKPWGTAHAILCAKEYLDAPFAVLNADDFYGADAYRKIYAFLKEDRPESECAMVGYQLGNTLSDFGSVARGVCEIGEDGKLVTLTERLKIEKRDGAAAFTEDDGQTYTPLALDTLVSMNLFGLQKTGLEKRIAEHDENQHQQDDHHAAVAAVFHLVAAATEGRGGRLPRGRRYMLATVVVQAHPFLSMIHVSH